MQKKVEHPVHFFEVDFQVIFDFKLPVLEREGAVSPYEYHNVVADLSIDTWPEVLLAAGYDPRVPTVWLLEGFINYLTAEEAAAVMQRLKDLPAPGSRLVATCLTAQSPCRAGALHSYFPDVFSVSTVGRVCRRRLTSSHRYAGERSLIRPTLPISCW